jgi:hypothetical protein
MSQEKSCRHEYVKIFQRRLKGLERRLVATPGYLPIGFKQGDFTHLGEGSFCFCTRCRARLYPRRTQAEKAAARLALAESKPAGVPEEYTEPALDLSEASERDAAELGSEALTEAAASEINVDELDYESTEMQDIESDRVKLSEADEDEGDLGESDEGL